MNHTEEQKAFQAIVGEEGATDMKLTAFAETLLKELEKMAPKPLLFLRKNSIKKPPFGGFSFLIEIHRHRPIVPGNKSQYRRR